MNQCDMCGHKSPKVSIGDSCPKCGQLVCVPVPNSGSRATEVEAYDIEASDEALAASVRQIAERNYRTLLTRKRRLEREAGLYVAPEPKAAPKSGTDEPPNADPAAATDPSVQPQPGGDDAEQDTPTT